MQKKRYEYVIFRLFEIFNAKLAIRKTQISFKNKNVSIKKDEFNDFSIVKLFAVIHFTRPNSDIVVNNLIFIYSKSFQKS
jgi:hypothetical protein